MPEHPQMIAVVDDDASVCRALGRLFRSAGYAVETFTSAAAFLAASGSRLPDCLVLDVEMPGMNGPELLSRLAASGVGVPAVVITGSNHAALESRAMEAGARAILRKPLADQALFDAVAAAIGRTAR